MARALIVLAVLFAASARADEDEDSWCALTGDAAETPMTVHPETKRCSARVCVGTFYRNMGFGHGASCLYAADAAGKMTDSVRLTYAEDLTDTALRILPDDTVEIALSYSDSVEQQRYRVDAQGKLVNLKPPPPPRKVKAAVVPPEPKEDGRCSMVGEPTECTGRAPSESVRQAVATACKMPDGEVSGTCSKAGCVVVASTHQYADGPWCMAWARRDQGPRVISFVEGTPLSLTLRGTTICMVASGGCPNGCDNSGCVDVSGPVPRWATSEGPRNVRGRASYDVLPYSGPPPRIDGKASELEWGKGRTLWMDTLLNVTEGLDAWRGPEDASAEWIVRWREGTLLLLARIHDDHVVAGDSLESNDAVGVGDAVLTLAPKGKFQVSGLAHATCAWAEAPGGYRLECSIPFEDLKLSAPTSEWNVGLSVTDRDGAGVPLKRLGGGLHGRAWKEFPPPWEEALPLLGTPW